MQFNSLQFLLFFPAVVIFYFKTPYKYRWVLLLCASYYFYMCWKPEYIFLIIASTLIYYICGNMMSRVAYKKRKKYLVFSILSNLGILLSFKYLNFFSETFTEIFSHLNIFVDIPQFDLLLPVGISFYTFQSLSYTIDVYRGDTAAEKHLGIFALYVSFFPQLVAGPIERSTRLLPQFRQHFSFDEKRVVGGLRLILWGLYKKTVIADWIGLVVDNVYNCPEEFQGLPLVIATVLFSFQIFCDFSAYSDIAIGASKVMGFKLMKNFNQPYMARSVAEFWRRWHISLSTWFRDYLFIPLGGSRVTVPRWYLNILLTFLLSGLWHGANWTFVIWGGLHAFYMVFSLVTKNAREIICRIIGIKKMPRLHTALKIFTTFTLTSFAWIFFRANTLSESLYIVRNLFPSTEYYVDCLTSWKHVYSALSCYGLGLTNVKVAILSIILMESVHLMQRYDFVCNRLLALPVYVRWSAYYSLVGMMIAFGYYGQQQFIYFQF